MTCQFRLPVVPFHEKVLSRADVAATILVSHSPSFHLYPSLVQYDEYSQL